MCVEHREESDVYMVLRMLFEHKIGYTNVQPDCIFGSHNE